MSAATGAFAYLSASHRDLLDGALHGHTWKVSIWISAEPPTDARALKGWLETVLRAWDHTVLSDELSSGEALCKAIFGLRGDGCLEVSAERAEGFLARWRP